MDFNASVTMHNMSYVSPYTSNDFGLNFSESNNPYSPHYRLENQPMYKLGALLREGFDKMTSNVSNAIGYLSETLSYSLNNLVSTYQQNNYLPPEISGLTNNITTFNAKDDDFVLLMQKLDAQFAPQNKVENQRLSVKAAAVNATYTNLFIKDREEYDSKVALSGLPHINLTEMISVYTPSLLNKISALTLEHIKNKAIVSSSTTEKSQETNNIDTILIHQVQFSYNPEKPDLSFSEAAELFDNQIDADKNLSPEILDYFGDKIIEQYPFIQNQPCKNLSTTSQNSINDIILSRTYSANPEATAYELSQALDIYSKFSYSTDIVKALAASLDGGNAFSAVPSDSHYTLKGASYAVHREEPLKFVHCQNTEEMTQHSIDKETDAVNRKGYYSPEFNVVTFKSEQDGQARNIFVPAFIHESSHAVINRLFKNDCKPFFKTDESQHALYEQAEIAVFKNLAQKLMLEENVDLLPFNTAENIMIAIKRSELLDTLVTEEDNVIATQLKVSEEEYLVLNELHSLIYHYPRDTISAELIVRIPQLLTQGVSTTTLETYFKPLMGYWAEAITPEVGKMMSNRLKAS